MSEAICAQSLSVREEPTDCCYVTKEESLQDSNLFGHSSCPVCKKDCGVSCRGAKHPVRQLVPEITVLDMHSRIETHRCESLHAALSQPLPFKLYSSMSKFVNQFPDVLELGSCEYEVAVDNFLRYPIVDHSFVSVWSITNGFLDILELIFNGDIYFHRSESKTLRRPDAVYYRRSHIIRVETRATTADLSAAELIDTYPPQAHLQFPQGSNEILGICTSIDTIETYRIIYDPSARQYSTVPVESFRLTILDQRLNFLVFLFKFARWVVTITGPTSYFHLVPGIQTRTPNGHHVTFTVDKLGRACIVKEFSRDSDVRFDFMEAVYRARLDNVEWGEVTSARMATVVIHRIGYTLLRALVECLISKEIVVQHIEAALNQLHSLGYAHCDVKFSNVFVDCDSTVAFLSDLEYIYPIEDPVPASVRVPRGAHPRTALELDQAQFEEFQNELYMM